MVEEELALTYVPLLTGSQSRDYETITDVDVELVS
jgi:hypothetical protein